MSNLDLKGGALDVTPARISRIVNIACKALSYRLHYPVNIRSFAHKGLRRLYAEDSVRGVPPDAAGKLRKILVFLDNMQDPEELHSLPAWKAHTLTGDRKGVWSLSVTRNQRLTFRIDITANEICELNLEDYH